MRFSGVIGDPVEHSLSPVMHNAAFAALGIDARYERWHVLAVDLANRIESLRGPECFGANVTVPHKEATARLVDELAPVAERLGASNTVINREGRLIGDNTDAYGFAQAVADVAVTGRRAVVLGAGGASRAVLVALQDLGARDIVLANRTLSRAESLAATFNEDGRPPIVAIGVEGLGEAVRRSALVVNATSLGWDGDSLPCSQDVFEGIPGEAVVMDLTYRETPFLRAAASRGLATLDGLTMLLHQGARSFETWTGMPAPVEVMHEALVAERARRIS